MNVGVRSRDPFMETMPVRPGGQQSYTGALSREATAGPFRCVNLCSYFVHIWSMSHFVFSHGHVHI